MLFVYKYYSNCRIKLTKIDKIWIQMFAEKNNRCNVIQ